MPRQSQVFRQCSCGEVFATRQQLAEHCALINSVRGDNDKPIHRPTVVITTTEQESRP